MQIVIPLKWARFMHFGLPTSVLLSFLEKCCSCRPNNILFQKCSPLKRAQIHVFWPPHIHIFFISQKKCCSFSQNDIISQKWGPVALRYSLQNENTLKIEKLVEFLQTGTPLKRAQIHVFWPPHIHIFFISPKVLLIQAKRYYIPKVQSFRLQIQFTE